MGVPGNVPHDARHPEVIAVISTKDLVHRVIVAKVFPGSRFRQDNGARLPQGRRRIAFHHLEAEEFENGGIGEIKALLVESLFFGFATDHPGNKRRFDPDIAFNFGIVGGQGRSPRRRSPGRPEKTPVPGLRLERQTVDLVALGDVTVVAELVLDIKKDQAAAGHAHSQAEKVDERVSPVLQEVSNGDLKIVFEQQTPSSYRYYVLSGQEVQGTRNSGDKPVKPLLLFLAGDARSISLFFVRRSVEQET
jgi:hypothetical protein